MGRFRLALAAVVLCAWLAACGGRVGPPGVSTAADDGGAGDGGGAPVSTAGGDAGEDVPSAAGGASGSGASSSDTPADGQQGADPAGGGQAPDDRPPAAGQRWTPANILEPDEDRIGITDATITLCMHAALVAGDVFNVRADDLQVYWEMVNEAGGIHGRTVQVFFTDDQYSPQGGVQAAEQCKARKPFFITGGVGFDTVPAVREWAERNRVPYLHSFATEKGADELDFSYMLPASVEQFGAVAGRYIGTRYPGKIGIVWRNSPNWQGGRDSFKREVEKRGAQVVRDIPVQQNQGEYTSVVLQLNNSGAETVLAWVNVLEFTQLQKQAAAQGFHPRWVTAAFNLVTDTVGGDIDGEPAPPAVGLWVAPEYHYGARDVPWAEEIERMETTYEQRRPGRGELTDVHWQAWLAFRQLHRLLEDCGRDCTRNMLLGMLRSGYQLDLPPLCRTDFARGGGRIGSFEFNVMEVTRRGNRAGWKQVETCREDF